MLAIELELLTGRYVATRYNDRTRPEWPPHPARLFSALAATHYAEEVRLKEERALLLWLEGLGPPSLRASTLEEVASPAPFTVFVPVNDPTVAGDLDARAPAKAKALVPGKISAEALEQARRVLPDGRQRQPRTFPSVRPGDATVHFVWPGAAPAPEQLAVLGGLLARLVRLGHSSSLVRARVVPAAPEPNWVPDAEGEHRLRIARAGQLEALDAAFELHRETAPHVLPMAFQRYTTRRKVAPVEVPRSVLDDDWIVLRRSGGPWLPATAAAAVSRSIRDALMKFAAEQPAPEVITGHAEDGGPSPRPHLAIVPLPFVGHSRADGTVLGVALVLPRAAAVIDRYEVFRALAAWESEERKEGEECPPLPVLLGKAGVLQVQRHEDAAAQPALRAESWCGPARRWATATPIALDRNPGELRDRNPDRAARAAGEAAATIRQSCARLGLPAPVRVTVCPHALLAGAPEARHFPPFPQAAGKPRRVLTHAELEFDGEVRGPLILGAGRYFGLGLLEPVEDDG